VLKDLNEARLVIEATEYGDPTIAANKPNKLQIIEIHEIFVYQRLIDIFGAVPYSEAIDIGNVYPVYELGPAVYADLASRLDAAIAALDITKGSFGSADLIYGGNVESWLKFANSMKLKMGIHLADVNPGTGQAMVEQAVAAGVLEAGDDALFAFQGSAPNYNTIHANLVVSGRNDFVPANTIVDIMVDRNDPRLDDYLNPATVRPFQYALDADGNKLDTTFAEGDNLIVFFRAEDGSFTSEFREGPFTLTADEAGWAWRGGIYGAPTSFATHSQISDWIREATFPGLIMTYSEVLFYLAEAAARGWNVGGTAEEFYNAGITESILWWEGTLGEAAEYLARPDVAYATAEGDWKRKIATQAWIASFCNGFLGYTTWRRLDWPVMNISPEAAGWPNEVTDVSRIPVRYTFPVNEQTLNGANYTAAAEAIGGDIVRTKIFWDIYDANDGK
jgi:hypothetical protein